MVSESDSYGGSTDDDSEPNRRLRSRRQSKKKKKRRSSKGYSTKRRKSTRREMSETPEPSQPSRSPSPSSPVPSSYNELNNLSNDSFSSSVNTNRSSLKNAGSLMTMANPFACVRPCKVTLHKLSPEFIEDATSGRIFWKKVFKGRAPKSLDLETYIRSKMKSIDEKNSSYNEDYIYYDDNKAGSKSWKEIDDEPINDECDEDGETSYKHGKKKRRKEIHVEYIPTPEAVEIGGRHLRVRKSKPRETLYCEECPFTTNESEVLLLHTAVHKSVCKECDLTFENKFKYQLHIYETHKPPIPLKNHIVYGCKLCQVHFDQESEAQQHAASHAKVGEGGKYACALCKSSFNKELSLQNHLNTKHISFKCTFCSFLGSNFDMLERHSVQSHAAYGKPYPCGLCDFRSATCGALLIHRKIYHALLREGDHERCRLCYVLLVGDREIILEHLAEHIDCCLLECNCCEFKTNSFQLMRSHGLDYHATTELDSFAKQMDLTEMVKKVKAILAAHYGEKSQKQTDRLKPTFTETNMAVAGLFSNRDMFEDTILDSPVKVVPMESYNINIQGVMCDQDPFLGAAIYGYSGVTTTTDPNISYPEVSNNHHENTEGHPPVTNEFIPEGDFRKPETSSQVNETNEAIYEDCVSDLNCSNADSFKSVDPLGLAVESTVNEVSSSSSVPIPSEGVLSVDPETGQLFLQGLPVFDEKGQAIYVSIHESASTLPQEQGQDQEKGEGQEQMSEENEEEENFVSKSVKGVQTVQEETAEPVPNGELI